MVQRGNVPDVRLRLVALDLNACYSRLPRTGDGGAGRIEEAHMYMHVGRMVLGREKRSLKKLQRPEDTLIYPEKEGQKLLT